MAVTTPSDIKVYAPPRRSCRVPLMLFVGGFLFGIAAASCVLLAVTGNRLLYSPAMSDAPEKVDFEFSIKGLFTPRQENKSMNVYVRWRYKPLADRCPFSPTNENCIQYQLWTRSLILNLTMHETPELPLGSEWERVNLAICRAIWAKYEVGILALSTSVHVNGDGRSAEERGKMPYEPGAHGSTCTIGPDVFQPLTERNLLPNLGPYR